MKDARALPTFPAYISPAKVCNDRVSCEKVKFKDVY